MSEADEIEALFSRDATRAREALAYAKALEDRVERLEAQVAELREACPQK